MLLRIADPRKVTSPPAYKSVTVPERAKQTESTPSEWVWVDRAIFDLVLAPMVGHTTAKRAQWQVAHELRKYELALVHDGFWRKPEKTDSLTFDVQIETRLKHQIQQVNH